MSKIKYPAGIVPRIDSKPSKNSVYLYSLHNTFITHIYHIQIVHASPCFLVFYVCTLVPDVELGNQEFYIGNALIGMSWRVGFLGLVPTATVSIRAFLFNDMSINKSTHFAMYGGVTMKRGYCEDCEGFSFVVDNKLSCCNRLFGDEAQAIKRICFPDGKRALSAKTKKEILKQQNHCCAYCWKELGSYVRRHGQLMKLKTHFDHQVPFKYVQETKSHNILAACHVCNLLKSDMMFETLDDVRLFLIQKRAEKGYDF